MSAASETTTRDGGQEAYLDVVLVPVARGHQRGGHEQRPEPGPAEEQHRRRGVRGAEGGGAGDVGALRARRRTAAAAWPGRRGPGWGAATRGAHVAGATPRDRRESRYLTDVCPHVTQTVEPFASRDAPKPSGAMARMRAGSLARPPVHGQWRRALCRRPSARGAAHGPCGRVGRRGCPRARARRPPGPDRPCT